MSFVGSLKRVMEMIFNALSLTYLNALGSIVAVLATKGFDLLYFVGVTILSYESFPSIIRKNTAMRDKLMRAGIIWNVDVFNNLLKTR